ncbi:hypothetical protein D4639_000206 [Escherichia coli]|uniref:Uncharacterized protein n=1 Tax=Escherichia coli TaxID=562 RepID=A0AAI9BC93_ECOLX|nr:hypothetical protein [Escherichia coli]HDQ6536478.1 hypothetical protein [Escherichia coli O36:H14]HDQ6568160.1 hypothetical protein [Escherichia coli Ou:H7]ANO89009.1 hypothetical protein GJ11_09765 [Escherichia coli]EEC7658453.1 hypothetical protein [Escherichia coli]EET2568076.1 hypothetical protein [Escherichia coli]
MSKHIYDDPKYRAEMRAQLVVSGYTPEQADTTMTELMGQLPFDEAEYEYWLKRYKLEIMENTTLPSLIRIIKSVVDNACYSGDCLAAAIATHALVNLLEVTGAVFLNPEKVLRDENTDDY